MWPLYINLIFVYLGYTWKTLIPSKLSFMHWFSVFCKESTAKQNSTTKDVSELSLMLRNTEVIYTAIHKLSKECKLFRLTAISCGAGLGTW